MEPIYIHYSEHHHTLRLSFRQDKLFHESTFNPEKAKWSIWLCAYHDKYTNADINGTLTAYIDVVSEMAELMLIQLQMSLLARDKLTLECTNDDLDRHRAQYCYNFTNYLLEDEWDDILKSDSQHGGE